MKARFAGQCEYCGGAIPAGEDCYFNLTTRKVSHHGCAPKVPKSERRETPEQLAKRLGYVATGELLGTDRPLSLLSRADRDRPAAAVGGDDAARGDQGALWDVPARDSREEWEA
jgi:hypothetical protein